METRRPRRAPTPQNRCRLLSSVASHVLPGAPAALHRRGLCLACARGRPRAPRPVPRRLDLRSGMDAESLRPEKGGGGRDRSGLAAHRH
ncbi:hypothetical protein U9M48_039111 [Paspalum notatum var. saurae]|uniref:Uncharacterized protein n=1 Tax=Paspalum notatum var. saurae TaxID=547442 RepID=A0AAQ3XE97_PASNO